MAIITREQVYEALFATISAATFASPIAGKTTWTTPTRKFRIPDKIPAEVQPTFDQFEGMQENYEQRGTGLIRRTIGARLMCYAWVNSGDPSEIGSTYLNTMMEAIEAQLVPDNPSQGTFTLGKLVHWCRIEGKVLRVTGDVEQQALLIVPILIMIP